MILVDANILMYAAGADHAHKTSCLELLSRVAEGEVDAALDAEVLQEVLHRYRAIERWSAGARVYDDARRIFSVVLPITVETLDLARHLLDGHRAIGARDALHAAVVELHQLEGICSYDRGFDLIPGVARIEPAGLTTV